jgi:tetratricopeptide (TPR) repeat protein
LQGDRKLRIAAGLAIVLFVAGLVVVGSRFLVANREMDRAQEAGDRMGQAQLEVELASLKKANTALAARVRALEERAADKAGLELEGEAPAKSEAVKAEVAADEASETSPEGADLAADREEKLAAAIEDLTRPDSSEEDWQRIWSQLSKDGLIDDAVLAFEERVKAEPRNADRHAQLGAAYLQKLVTVNDLEKVTWAMKSDKAFDEALAIDERHWDARFTKAAALSYWPAITGKPAEAMKHFETLRTQQEEAAPQKKFANTYLILGNLYQNQGNAAKASETWQRGAELHPDNTELRAKAEAAAEK